MDIPNPFLIFQATDEGDTPLNILPPLGACRNQRSGDLRVWTGSGGESTPFSSYPTCGQDVLLRGIKKRHRRDRRGHRETCGHASSVLENDTEDSGEFCLLRVQNVPIYMLQGTSYCLLCPMCGRHPIKLWWTNLTKWLLLFPFTVQSWRRVVTVLAAVY